MTFLTNISLSLIHFNTSTSGSADLSLLCDGTETADNFVLVPSYFSATSKTENKSGYISGFTKTYNQETKTLTVSASGRAVGDGYAVNSLSVTLEIYMIK